MADEENTEEEPSIEEILDSIRQIISDDDEEEGGDAAPEPAEEPEEEIVELTDKVDDEPAPEPEPEPEADPEPEPEPEVDPEPEPEPEPEDVEIDMQDPEPEPEAEVNQEEDSDALFTEIAETATADGFEKLVKKTAVEYNGITLEEIVRTELKPLLREWLDDNLPSMIERLVQEELERISKRVLDD